MRRALVGFSSPIGYSYKFPAARSVNDYQSSPNPVLLGSMGLFTLYDELWFACESLCPQSMRQLPYVRFVDHEVPGLHPRAQGIEQFTRDTKFQGSADLNDLFDNGYRDMENFFGPNGAVDNHTHGLGFFDFQLNGNPGADQLATDIWLLEHLRNFDLELVFNPITAKIAFDGAQGIGWPIRREAYDELRLADGIISLRNLYDITGPDGPYHPCIEDIRGDDLIKAFRRWLAGERGRLSNRELDDVQREVDERVFELTFDSIGKHADQFHPKNVAVDLIKEKLSEAIGIPWPLIEYLGHAGEAREQRSYSFIARAHLQQKYRFGGNRS